MPIMVTMRVNLPPISVRFGAWLIGADALLGLLLGTALLILSEDPRWGTLLLLLTSGVAAGLALLQTRLARAEAVGRQAGAAPLPVRETADDLPVYPATGLYRPWVFRQRLDEELARDRRYDHTLAIVVLEPANLLAEPTAEGYALAAKALRRALRVGDLAAQFDDERFAVLLPETDYEGAKAAARRLLATLRASGNPPARWRGALVSYPEDGSDAQALLERALILLRPGRLQSTTEAMATPQAGAQRQPAAPGA